MQALAGYFVKRRHYGAAVMILAGHRCMLRTCELFELRTGDGTFLADRALLVLRETKMGQRVGVHQETTVTDSWLLPRLRAIHAATTPDLPLVGMSPNAFRATWKEARAFTGVPTRYTPYSWRCGGATAMFQWCGKFDKVADKGRWNSLPACRLYITTALAELATAEEERALAPSWMRLRGTSMICRYEGWLCEATRLGGYDPHLPYRTSDIGHSTSLSIQPP